MVLYVFVEPIFLFHKDFYLFCIYKHVGECCVKCQAFEDLAEKSYGGEKLLPAV